MNKETETCLFSQFHDDNDALQCILRSTQRTNEFRFWDIQGVPVKVTEFLIEITLEIFGLVLIFLESGAV